MNDLTFGAALLAFMATLITAVVIELAGPQPVARTVARATPAALLLAQSGEGDCGAGTRIATR